MFTRERGLEREGSGGSVCAQVPPGARNSAGEEEETQKRQTHNESLCHGGESVWIANISGSERRRQELEVGSCRSVKLLAHIWCGVCVCLRRKKGVKVVLGGIFLHPFRIIKCI